METHNSTENVLEGEGQSPSPTHETQPEATASASGASGADARTAQPLPDLAAEFQARLDAANAKAAEYLEGWQRARADFANYKKRIERENAEISQTAAANVLTRLLPVLDDFDLALKNPPAEGDSAKWAAGIALVHRKLNTLLEREGIARIEAEGKPFDPQLHEAVVQEENTGHASGAVIEVLRQGYKLGDRVLRPALVKVAK